MCFNDIVVNKMTFISKNCWFQYVFINIHFLNLTYIKIIIIGTWDGLRRFFNTKSATQSYNFEKWYF